MKIYTTYGTYDYLNQIRLNHPENHLFIYSTNDSSVIIEESEDKSILKHPTTYEVVNEINELNHQHFYSAIFIPSSEDHVNQLEKRLSNLNLDFSQFAGFKSYRFLDLKKVLLIKFTLASLIVKHTKILNHLICLMIIFLKKH